MCSAPNVYIFVYTLIGAQIVPLSAMDIRERVKGGEGRGIELNVFLKPRNMKKN